MTTKHMNLTPEEIRDDTAMLFMIVMMYLTLPEPKGNLRHPLWVAARNNDKRWMAGRQTIHPDGALLDFDYYRDLASITFEI